MVSGDTDTAGKRFDVLSFYMTYSKTLPNFHRKISLRSWAGTEVNSTHFRSPTKYTLLLKTITYVDSRPAETHNINFNAKFGTKMKLLSCSISFVQIYRVDH